MRFDPNTPTPSTIFPNQAMPDLAEFMTAKEAAKELGYTARGIHMLIKKDKLEAVSVGRMYLVSKKSVKAYLDKTQGMSKNDPTRGKENPQE
ncbi:MAG TPA: helix-turn-helix domain-containing protein [Anaerolineales bacterium]|jgi:excisionase family DNA binding protein